MAAPNFAIVFVMLLGACLIEIRASPVDKFLRRMNLEQKVAQLVQHDMNVIGVMDYDPESNTMVMNAGKLASYINNTRGMGSLFSAPSGVAILHGDMKIVPVTTNKTELWPILQNALKQTCGDLPAYVTGIQDCDPHNCKATFILICINADNCYPIESILRSDTPFPPLKAAGVQGIVLREPIGPPTLRQWRQYMTTIWTVSRSIPPYIPILFGVDSLHGAGYIYNATIFPQQVGIGATFNPAMARIAGEITAKETRAAGMHWIFGPCLDILSLPVWPRGYETFGEDPHEVSMLGIEMIHGMQGTTPGKFGMYDYKVAATLKHFIGYSNPRSGQDEAPVWLPDTIALQYFMPPAKAAVQAGVATAMSSFGELNGRPILMSRRYLRQWLRIYLNFQGVVVTDYDEINKLHGFHWAVADEYEATRVTLQQTSVDMTMIADDTLFTPRVLQLVKEGELSSKRVLESTRRVLELKNGLGLLTDNEPVPTLPTDKCVFACPEHRQAAYDMVSESITLLQNVNATLPVNVTATRKILVTGPMGNSLRHQSGGWTMHWQGAYSESQFAYGTTVFAGLTESFPDAEVVFEAGCEHNTEECSPNGFKKAVSAARDADLIVACIGEAPYTEFFGNIVDLRLPSGQVKLIRAISDTIGQHARMVVVLIEGRPRLLSDIPARAHAVMHTYLPGPVGGRVVADIITGKVNPSGRLPFTYPKYANAGPVQYYHSLTQVTESQWSFGHGLSYTTFKYGGPVVTVDGHLPDSIVHVAFTIENAGTRDGKEAVLVFSRRPFSVMPEAKRLRAFAKVFLTVGEKRSLNLQFPVSSLCYIDDVTNGCFLDAGDYFVQVGGYEVKFHLSSGWQYPGPQRAKPIPQLTKPETWGFPFWSWFTLGCTFMATLVVLAVVAVRKHWVPNLNLGDSDGLAAGYFKNYNSMDS